ncbi:hypothetical protein AA129_001282 [Salmonella enterica subsp. enterica serovar Lexington]|nr:hypothetical protein [Salmonella enterica subsp. enterica serovar Lexington]
MVISEIRALHRIRDREVCTGSISPMILCTRPDHLIFDRHAWDLYMTSPDPRQEWNEDIFAERMIIVRFHDRDSFQRAYRVVRLLRGRVEHLEGLTTETTNL